MFEQLEIRRLLTLGTPAWIEAGPGPNFLEDPINDQFVSGAVNALAPHPGNADILFAGTVNGGIWRTENATDPNPTWTPTTDQMESLAISDLAFSPLDCEAGNAANQTCQTLYASTGSFSSFGDEGGLPVGIYRTDSGGDTWNQLGEETFGLQTFADLSVRFGDAQFARRIRDVVPTNLTENGGQVVLVGTDSYVRDDGLAITTLRQTDNTPLDQLGVWRSADSGQTWSQITNGLPGLPVSDLIADPANDNRFYAAIPREGVFVSNDGGLTWTATANNQIPNAASANRIFLSVHNSPGNNVVYAGVLTSSGGVEGVGLETVYRSTDQGNSWVAMSDPRDNLGPLHRAQGQRHGSLLADESNPNVVYAGGASQIVSGNNGCGWSGRHFRGDASTGSWTTLECTPSDTTNAHADSRVMVFDANGDLLEGNDGSVYRLTNRDDPQTRQWISLTGNINSFELSSIAYDSLNNVYISGSQDNGSPQQNAEGSAVWSDVTGGDGQIVQVDNISMPGFSIRYSSAQNLDGFKRETFDSQNRLIRSDFVRLSLASGGALFQSDELPFETEYTLNTVDPTRMILATLGTRGVDGTGNVYISMNQGDTLELIGSNIGHVNALAYGGTRDDTVNLDVAYVGTEDGLWLRTGASENLRLLESFAGAEPLDIAVDADDWQLAYVLDAEGRVWRTSDAGQSFEELTGNLLAPLDAGGPGAAILQSIELFSNSSDTGDEVVFLGGLGGVFATDDPYANETTNWVEFGTGLPNVQVKDVRFDATDNLLYVATLGRGAWSVPNLSDSLGSGAPVIDLNGAETGRNIEVTFNPLENSAIFITADNATLADVDSTTLQSTTITLRSLREREEAILEADTTGTNITSSYDIVGEDGVLTLTGADTLENYQAVLQTVIFDIDGEAAPIAREVVVVANDGLNNSSPSLATIRFSNEEPAPIPVVDLNGPDVEGIDIVRRYVENSGPLLLAPNGTISHPAGTDLELLDILLFECADDEFCEIEETISADTTGTNITATYIASEGNLLLEGRDTLENYQRVLRTVAYENISDGFTFLIGEFDFLAVDVDDNLNAFTLATLEFENVNDAPVLDTSFGFTFPVSLSECDQTAEQSQGIFEDDLDSCFQQKGDLTDDVVLSAFYLGNDAAFAAFDDVDLQFEDIGDDDDLNFPSIAVVGVDNTNGLWQFSTDSAETWRTFENVTESSAVLLSSDISNRIRFVPNQDYHGTVTNGLSFRAWDQTTANPNVLEELKRSGRRADTTTNGGSTAFSSEIGELAITVFAVNDAPSFSLGEDQRVSENSGAQIVPGWASDIVAGPANESGQTLTFIVDNNNSSLFAEQPSISDDGTLRFTPALDAAGMAEVSVRLVDDGGSENGGSDTSSTQTFRIDVGDRLIADADSDGQVGFSDFLILSANFGRQDDDVMFADGDFNEDQMVSFADFLLLSANFGLRE